MLKCEEGIARKKRDRKRTRARDALKEEKKLNNHNYLFNYISVFISGIPPYSTNFYNQYLMFVFFIIFLCVYLATQQARLHVLLFLSRCIVVVVLIDFAQGMVKLK